MAGHKCKLVRKKMILSYDIEALKGILYFVNLSDNVQNNSSAFYGQYLPENTRDFRPWTFGSSYCEVLVCPLSYLSAFICRSECMPSVCL